MLSSILYIENLVIVAFDIAICYMKLGLFFWNHLCPKIIYSPIMKTI
jgi:hypothetical protein